MKLQTRIAELGNIRNFLTGSLLTLALDAVFSVIYIAVMFVYSGVLTAVTLGVVPLFLGLTIVASPAIRSQLRKLLSRNAQTQALLVESSMVSKLLRHRMLKIMCVGSGKNVILHL